MNGEAMNEIYIFLASQDEISGIINSKNLNFLFIIYNFKLGRYFALNDVILVHTLRHMNDDVA